LFAFQRLDLAEYVDVVTVGKLYKTAPCCSARTINLILRYVRHSRDQEWPEYLESWCKKVPGPNGRIVELTRYESS
jgi:hypothetical protein